MSVAIIWSPEAREDLLEIERFIARDSPAHALAVAQKIDLSVARLALFPASGHRVWERKARHLREIIVFNYRVIYRLEADRVIIGGVVHGARSLRKALRGRPGM